MIKIYSSVYKYLEASLPHIVIACNYYARISVLFCKEKREIAVLVVHGSCTAITIIALNSFSHFHFSDTSVMDGGVLKERALRFHLFYSSYFGLVD